MIDIKDILENHRQWCRDNTTGKRANLSGADLSGASLCRATIDGAVLAVDDIGGPGHILCALTCREWATIQEGRKTPAMEKPNNDH